MDDIKRKSSITDSSEGKAKKLRMNQSITCIENVSNELFYEILDYLCDCEIYEAFLKLNNRFEELLNSSSLLLKIKDDYLNLESADTFMNNYLEIMRYKQNQIYSIDL